MPLAALVFILATERPSGMIIGIAIMAAILGALHRISLHLWPGAMFPWTCQEDNTAIEMEVVVRNINLGFLLFYPKEP